MRARTGSGPTQPDVRLQPPVKTERTKHRVVKTLLPADRGAIALAQRCRVALVCVRHRTDAKGRFRETTVELLVRATSIRPRTVRIVGVKAEPHERALHSLLKAEGSTWNAHARPWRPPPRVAGILNLRDRIVEEQADRDPPLSSGGHPSRNVTTSSRVNRQLPTKCLSRPI
jgi:hypothetical protein